MSGAKHTPGPWVVRYAKPGIAQEPYEVHAASGERILRWGAFIKPASERATANANLIAAAPDMAEALEALVKKADERRIIPEALFDAARAALSRAHGSSGGEK